MKDCILALSDSFLLLCAGAISVILFLVIYRTFEQMSFFGKKTRVVVAICVSLLCVLGLHQHFFVMTESSGTAEEGGQPTNNINFLLLPYTALALAILLTLLFLFLFGKFDDKGRKGRIKHREGRVQRLRRCEKPNEDRLIK